MIELRALLAERWPNLRILSEPSPVKSQAYYPTGLPVLDRLLEGGLPKGAITELVRAKDAAGAALLIRALLRRAYDAHQFLALIDSQDNFDAAPLDPAILTRLLWVRCRNADEALKAADLLARDGNLPLVILDLTSNSLTQLRRIPGTTWYRLQRLIEQTTSAWLVMTPRPMVSPAEVKLILPSQFSLEALAQPEEKLLTQLTIKLVQRRSQSGEFLDERLAQTG